MGDLSAKVIPLLLAFEEAGILLIEWETMLQQTLGYPLVWDGVSRNPLLSSR
jgi:hypothetical protein